MNEWMKTGVFAGLALFVVLIAVISQPRIANVALDEMEGKLLFADKFNESNQDDAARLEIVTFDEKLGKLRSFSVGKQKDTGQWAIEPEQYPADNQQQLVDAMASLMGLKVIGVHSEVEQDKEACQVVEPNIDDLTTSSSGVGTLVTIRDKNNRAMASLVIGKKVSEEGNNRYVRLPGDNNVIYVVEVDTASLTTDFKDWIETDLLDLASLDIRSVLLKDYAIIPSSQGRLQLQMKSDVNLRWDAEESTWILDSMTQYKDNEPTETTLAENEELNSQTLNDLKFALDDLEIDSVEKKPEGLGADLVVEANLANNVEGVRSLQQLGFFPVQNEEGDGIELLSANGEMHVSLQTGIQYVIRFGEIVGDISADAEGIQRYMVVTARLDESMLTPPTLEAETPGEVELPVEPEPTEPADPASEDKPDDTDPEADGSDAVEDEPAEEAATSEGGEEKPAEEKPAEEKPAEDEPAAEVPAEPTAEEEEVAKLELERKMNEYQDKRNDAIKRVQELNERFADWYYLISEETYSKLHLGISDLITEKEESDGGLGEFRDLENKGLDLPLPPGLPEGIPPSPPQ
jgi:hypothetical protein